MVKDTTRRPGRSSLRDGPRKPVTIDLPAAEVGRRPGAAGESAAPEAAPPEQPTEFSAESVAEPWQEQPAEAAAERGAEQNQFAAEPEIAAEFDAIDPETAAPRAADASWTPGEPEEPVASAPFAAQSEADVPPPPPSPRSTRGGPSVAALGAAGLAGGAIVALAVLFMALAGLFSPAEEARPDLAPEIAALRGEIAGLRQAQSAASVVDLAPLDTKLADLEAALAALRNDPALAAADGAALEELQSRLAELEGAGGPGPTDLSGVEQSIVELRQQVMRLAGQLESTPAAERVAALEAGLAETSAEAKIGVSLGAAVAADALAAAVESGRPFPAELAALKVLRVDEAALAGLESYAATGLPTLAGLSSGFEAAIATVELASPIPRDAGTIERLLESARGLVDVRPAHPAEGADPGAIVTRIRAALAAGDLKTALAERDGLPEQVKAATEAWAGAAASRLEADELVARLRADALSRLGTEG